MLDFVIEERRPEWSTAVPDWRDRIRERRSLIPALPLHEAVAAKALRIFKRLRVPDLIGMPTYGEVCEPWVFDLVRAIFGAYDPETRRRAIREAFVLIPKKNGKSSIAAAIIVTAAIMNERPEAQIFLIAPTIEVAKIAFNQAWGIIRADQDLSRVFHAQEHLKQITHRISRAVIGIKAADTDVVTGGKASFVLVDETHEFAKKSKAESIFLELRGGFASRAEGFLLQITTQSKEPPAGVFLQELTRARAVRDGKLSLPILAVLYELPEDMVERWQDQATWPLVNPNLGVSVDPGYLADQLEAARADGPHSLALLASQHFNVEIGVGLRARSWIGAQFWGGAEEAGLTLDEILDRSEVAVCGVDGGGLDDLLGLAVIGRCRKTKHWLTWAHAWAHPEVLELRPEIAARLRDFAAVGDLTIVGDGDRTGDVTGVADLVARVLAADLLPEKAAVGLDPAGVSAILDELTMRGVSDDQMVAVGQGYRLSPAIWGLERKLKDGTFRHGGQPMMNWVLGNAKTEQRGSAVIVTKETAGKAKIDPLVAIFNAFMLMARNPVAASGLTISVPADYRVA